MLSIISLLVVVTLSILVTRIATVALTHTGLSRESAKFQARSAFTGVGFTTGESEKVVNHPVRRRILLMLMLLGNAGVVTAVSSLIISFVNLGGDSQSLFWQLFLLVSGLILLWAIATSKWVDRHLSNLISKVLKKYTKISAHDFAKLLHLAGEYQITEMSVEEGDWLADQNIADLKLRNEGVVVLGITKKDGEYVGAPDGNTAIESSDTLLLYGRASVIEQIDNREAGIAGDKEHEKKTEEHAKIKDNERAKQPKP